MGCNKIFCFFVSIYSEVFSSQNNNIDFDFYFVDAVFCSEKYLVLFYCSSKNFRNKRFLKNVSVNKIKMMETFGFTWVL